MARKGKSGTDDGPLFSRKSVRITTSDGTKVYAEGSVHLDKDTVIAGGDVNVTRGGDTRRGWGIFSRRKR